MEAIVSVQCWLQSRIETTAGRISKARVCCLQLAKFLRGDVQLLLNLSYLAFQSRWNKCAGDALQVLLKLATSAKSVFLVPSSRERKKKKSLAAQQNQQEGPHQAALLSLFSENEREEKCGFQQIRSARDDLVFRVWLCSGGLLRRFTYCLKLGVLAPPAAF